MGIWADVLSLEQAVARAGELLRDRGPSYIASVNPEIVMKALADEELCHLLNSAHMALPDGVGIVLTSRLKGGDIRRRVTGIDLMERLLLLAAEEGYRVFFLGSAPGLAAKAAEKCKEAYPGLQVAGYHHGYFSTAEEGNVVERIAAARTDLLFIGMGADRQELFMFRWGPACGARLLMVVGGSMDVLSGHKKRAPGWIQRLGAEWLFRVLQEPRRLQRISVLPRFMVKALAPVRQGRLRLLGIYVDLITYKGALEKVQHHIHTGKPLWIAAINPEKVVAAWDSPELRSLLVQCGLALPDGTGILIAGWFQGYRFPERVTGVDLFLMLAEKAVEEGWPIYLLGAAPGVAEKTAQRLQDAYPGLKIAGTHHGYYSPAQEPALVEQIRSLKPALLFAALGSPKQEKFIAAHLETLGAPICMGVGGSFDVISGRVRRAPYWMQKAGLEWTFRFILEPRRAWRLLSLPRFIFLALLSRLGLLRSKQAEG